MNENAPAPIDTRQVVTLLRKGWMVIVLVAGVATVVALAWSLLQTPMYRSTAVVSLNPVVGMDSVSGATVSAGAVQSQLDLIAAGSTADIVVERIGSPAQASAARASVETPNIAITGVSSNPERAALIANTYAEVYAELRRDQDLQRNNDAAAVIQELLDEADAQLVALGEDPTGNTPSTGAGGVAASELRTQQRTYQQQLASLSDQARFIERGRVEVL